MREPKENRTVINLTVDEDSPDRYARIQSIYPDGGVWVVNLNMPYMGTTSKIYSKEEFDQIFEVI